MPKTNKDYEPLQVSVDEKEAQYLQRLGLKTLLTEKFQPTMASMWQWLIKHRQLFYLSIVSGLFAFLLCAVFVLSKHTQRLKAQSKKQRILLDTRNSDLAEVRKKLGAEVESKTVRVVYEGFGKENEREFAMKALTETLMGKMDATQRTGRYEQTILHHAAHLGVNIRTMIQLVELGADPNAQANSRDLEEKIVPKSFDGHTPLMILISHNYFGLANEFQLKVKAVDVNIGTVRGRTALKMCLRRQQELIDSSKTVPKKLKLLITSLTDKKEFVN